MPPTKQKAQINPGLSFQLDEKRGSCHRPDASIWPPDSLTADWARTLRTLKLPKVTLHALRHTHVSQLIAAGLDVVTVSRRIRHANPTVTLNVYAHLFGNTDERAAEAVETALAGVLAG